MRSSDSVGVSLVNGSVTSASSVRRILGEDALELVHRPLVDLAQPAAAESSRGARRASSSSERTIDAMRMSFVGRVTCS